MILVRALADVVVSGRYYVLAKIPRGTGLKMSEEAKSMDEEQRLVNLLEFCVLMTFDSITRLWG